MPPILGRGARVLVLGSMPGAASLAAQRYYAHPQNAFWSIMAALCGAGRELSYAERCARLKAAGIAVWDVLARCSRDGSLDSDIERQSIATNDFAALFARAPQLQLVGCNGTTAHECYRRRVLPTLPPSAAAIPVVLLPSTSPANAGTSRAAKTARWLAALQPRLAT